MAIWDVFTGESAERAAEQNRALYQRYGQQGLADLGSAYAPTLSAVQGATAAFQPLSDLGAKYGQGTDLYMNALGINGPAGTTAAQNAFQTSPGYQFKVGEAVDKGTRAAARFSPGGNEIDAVTRIASGLAGDEWNNWLRALQGFGPMEQQAVTGAAAGTAAGKGAEAGFYQSDALNRVNLRGNVAGGIAGSNTAAAQAQMNASGQFWTALANLGGNVAKAVALSDRRLKTAIVRTGDDPRGFGRYSYRYVWDEPGVRRNGYMADEVERVRPDAVLRNADGFAMIDYGALES
jgi:hypothetical protein